MLIETLQQYGLTEKESKVYLAGLSLGSAPGSTIARHAGENRITVYSILKELVKKGIFTVLERGGISYFSPISPEILVRNQEDKYHALREKLPEFMALIDKSNNKPKVQFFEGIEGLKKLFDDFSTSTINMETIIGTPDSHNDILLVASENYRKKRAENGLISKRIITGANKNMKQEKQEDKLYGRNTILIKESPFNIDADINIYGPGKVSFLFFDKDNNTPYAVILQNDDVYNTLHGIFQYIWAINGGK